MGTRGKRARVFMAALAALLAAVTLTAGPPNIWIDVPFIAQTKEGCGSASIAMVMRYWEQKGGVKDSAAAANADKIQAQLYSRAAGGIFASGMEKYFRDAGYRVFAFKGEWADLNHHLQQGRPLIVGVKASGAHGPYHYVVVVGLDSERGYIFLNDPAQQRMLRVSREGFESEWKFTQNWTLLAVPQAAD